MSGGFRGQSAGIQRGRVVRVLLDKLHVDFHGLFRRRRHAVLRRVVRKVAVGQILREGRHHNFGLQTLGDGFAAAAAGRTVRTRASSKMCLRGALAEASTTRLPRSISDCHAAPETADAPSSLTASGVFSALAVIWARAALAGDGMALAKNHAIRITSRLHVSFRIYACRYVLYYENDSWTVPLRGRAL
jgi:hypothetical protein